MDSSVLALTTLCCNDRRTLFPTLLSIIKRTNLPVCKWYILTQGCSESFLKNVDRTLNFIKNETQSQESPNSNTRVEFELLTYKENLGLSKAANILAEKTKHFKYVMHIEDDWLCLPTTVTGLSRNWLSNCLAFLEQNPSVSTIFLRKYADEADKHKYAWNRYVRYTTHKFPNNYNYSEKMRRCPKVVFADIILQEIPDFLFTFNPCIRRNADYFQKGVFPLTEYSDAVKKRDNWTLTSYADAPNWGQCEAEAMEKIRDLKCFNLHAGVFGHYEDWINTLTRLHFDY